MTSNERLAEAVRRVAERGIELPPDFALERARNIVSALVDLFDDAKDEGKHIGRRNGEPVGAAISAAVDEIGPRHNGSGPWWDPEED